MRESKLKFVLRGVLESKLKFVLRTCLILALALIVAGCQNQPAATASDSAASRAHLARPLAATGEVVIAGHRLVVELPQTPEESARGLMFRDSLPDDHGMLFYYDRPEFLSFWMRNTRLPLSIAFIDASGRIDAILDMQPMDAQRRYFPEHRCVAALEVNQGWFAARGIAAGATVEFKLPADFRKLPLGPR